METPTIHIHAYQRWFINIISYKPYNLTLNPIITLWQVPVFRELYSEKRVVLEERRARVDNSPLGKFQEEFNQRAFANNYSRCLCLGQSPSTAISPQNV